MSTTLVVLTVLACWRLTHLLTVDQIFDGLRKRVGRRGEGLAYLVTCPWCLSMWLSPFLVIPAVLWPTNRAVWAVMLILVGSGAAGMLQTIEDRLDR
jgi:hypothetical protein